MTVGSDSYRHDSKCHVYCDNYSLYKTINRNFASPSFPPLFHPNGSVATTATEKAEWLASLFATNSTLDDEGLNPPSYTPQTNRMSKIIFRPQIIKKLKSDSAAGPDDIPPILIKKCAPELAPTFYLNYSNSLMNRAYSPKAGK